MDKIYGKGFLPFRNRLNLFYQARSCRVDLDKFFLSSENKRILKNTADLNFKIKKLTDFNYQPGVQKNCKDWAKTSGWKISSSSLKYLFSGQFFNYLFIWEKNKEVVGYQLFYVEENFLHTAYVFYNSAETGKGQALRMLIEGSLWGQENKKNYHYLGTAYGSAGYAKRALSGFEFFNGFSWSKKIEEWKYLDKRKENDYLFRDQEYWAKFWPEERPEGIFKNKGVSFSK